MQENPEDFEANELDSTGGVPDDELTRRFQEAIRIEIERKQKKGLPVARYDAERRVAYLEFPDGRREDVQTS